MTASRTTHPDLEPDVDALGVEGWLSPGQIATLRDAASACGPGATIVEIGSFRGRSTIVLAAAAPPTTTVIAIDPHAGNDRGPGEIEGFGPEAAEDGARFRENLARAGVADRVRHVREFSQHAHDAVDGRIDLLYIDGAHRFAPARRDIAEWGARVRDDGVLLIHDSFSSIGVTAALVTELFCTRRFRYVGRARSLAIYRADLGAGDVPGNTLRQAAQLGWFARNVALKVLLTLGMGRVLRRVGKDAPEWPY